MGLIPASGCLRRSLQKRYQASRSAKGRPHLNQWRGSLHLRRCQVVAVGLVGSFQLVEQLGQLDMGGGEKFNEEQMDWLRMIRDHVVNSFHIERDDLEMSPFDGQGGQGKMVQLFGARMESLLDEMNEVLVA